VLAQVSRDATDERFPLLIYEAADFDDFVLTTRFQIVEGEVDQMAGIAFRLQDERNYYVVRASAKGNTLRFYKFVDGVRGPPVGPEVPVAAGVWHELKVECQGNQIRCWLNGEQVLPTLTDNSFDRGKIGFWTKSDSVSYFAGTRLTWTPREPLAQALVRDALRQYPRLLGLRISLTRPGQVEPQIVGSQDPAEVGQAANKTEGEVLARAEGYYGKERDRAIVTLPLRDRNGDTVAAVRIVLQSFPGQTEQNALARATPIVKQMEKRVRSARDLTP
jgi:hypothetical protein